MCRSSAGGKGLPWWDKFRLGFMWGMSLSQQDLDKYVLYFVLSSTHYHCHFLKGYSWFFMVQGIATASFTPLSGILTDMTQKQQHWTMICSSLFCTLGLLMEIMGFFHFNVWFLFSVWMLRQFASVQNQSSCWKLIKMRIKAKTRLDHLEEVNLLISNIGNIGDITSDIFEFTLLGSTYVIPLLWHGYTDEIMRASLIGGALLANVLVLAASLTITKSQITCDNHMMASINDEEKVQLIGPANGDIKKDESVWHFFVNRFSYFFHNKVALHALGHCLLVGTFYNLVEYPLTLSESEILSHTVHSHHGEVCKGLLRDLMNQGAFLNATFLVGSVLFGIFIVPCKPYHFYSKMYLFLGTILLGTTMVLWFKMPPVPTFIIVSVSQVMPYYLSTYDFYVLTSSVEEVYYGFISSIYSLGYILIGLVPGLFLLISLSNDVIIVVCLAVLCISMAYGLVFASAYRAELQKSVIKDT